MSTFSYRVTTGGVLRNYRSDLYRSYSKLQSAMTRVSTQKQYNAYYEDTSAASRAFEIRRSLWRTNDQLTNTNNTISIFDTAFSAVGYICDGDTTNPGLNGIVPTLEDLNDPTGDARISLAQEIDSECESVLQLMNATYNGNFVFAGTDGKNVPFTWGTDENGNTVMCYRGINVNTPDPASIEQFQEEVQSQIDEARQRIQDLVDSALEQSEDDSAVTKDILDSEGNKIGTLTTTTEPIYDDDGNETGTVTTKTTVIADSSNLPDKASVTTTTEVTKTIGDGKTTETNSTTVTMALEGATDADGNPTGDWTLTTTTKVDGGDDETETETITAPETLFAEKYGVTYADAKRDYAKLQAFTEEASYVDIGIGLQEDEAGLVPTSAYNTALCGLNFVGWGYDEDGDPKNIVSIMQRISEITKRCVDGDFATAEDEEDMNRLTNKLIAANDKVSEAHVELSAKVSYLNANASLLTNTKYNLDTQRANLEDIDEAYAITEMNYANYCYQAALKIGNEVLSQSLLDYMS